MHPLNKISIKQYLQNKGIYPVKEYGYYGMYHSPLREDHTASLKVDYSKNLWKDFGSNDGGTLIDLVMRIENCSVHEVMTKLERQYGEIESFDSFSFRRKESESPIAIQEITQLTHPALLQYLDKRAIEIDLVRMYCKQIHYSIDNRNYFAIGFKNDSDNWNLRSEYFKGCTSMDITSYVNTDINKECCLVFEGFTDYLSYLTMKNMDMPKVNVIILNSVNNLSKAMELIQSHSKIYCYLDNDDAGRKATNHIMKNCSTVIDQSLKYAKYKDLNNYLVDTKKVQKVEIKRKPSRGLRR